MSRRDITDFELEEGSIGVEGDIHYTRTCNPIVEVGYYMRGNHTNSDVVFHFRNCRCESYDQETCYHNLEKFRRTWVPLPTDGIFIHRLDCIYELKKLKRHYWEDNKRKKCYKYVYNCTCRYTLNPRTARHDPNDRGEFLVYMKYMSKTIKFVGFYFVLFKILPIKTVLLYN